MQEIPEFSGGILDGQSGQNSWNDIIITKLVYCYYFFYYYTLAHGKGLVFKLKAGRGK